MRDADIAAGRPPTLGIHVIVGSGVVAIIGWCRMMMWHYIDGLNARSYELALHGLVISLYLGLSVWVTVRAVRAFTPRPRRRVLSLLIATVLMFAYALGTVAINTVAIVLIQPFRPLTFAQAWPQLLARDFHSALFDVGIIAAVAYGVHLHTLQAQRLLRLQRLAAESARAQFEELSAHVSPHFIFNTLNAITALVRSDGPAAERMLSDLAGVIRRSLAMSTDSLATVAEEVAVVRHHFDVISTREDNRIALRTTVPPDATHVLLPRFVLEPLVGVALARCLERPGERWLVDVILGVCDRMLAISIACRRRGLAPSTPWIGEPFPAAAAVEHLRGRLESHYGSDFLLDVSEPEPEELEIYVALPVTEQDEAGAATA